MIKYILTLIMLMQIGFVMAQQAPKVAKKYFKDPSIKINTPWFEKGRNFTTYDEMMSFMSNMVDNKQNIASLFFIGETQKGIKIPGIRITKNTDSPKVKVLFLGRIHGDEPGSTEGCLYLMERLLNDKKLSYLLDKLDITFIPMVNIDGGMTLKRQTHNSLDLNRDQSKLSTPEALALRAFYNDYSPNVVIDFHEFQPLRADYAYISSDNITNSFDAMFLYSGNLNIPQELRDLTGDLFVGNAQQALEAQDLRYHDYFTTSRNYGEVVFSVGGINPRSTPNAFALSNSVAILMEIRGVRLGKTSLKRRVYTIYTLGESFLKTAYENAEKVLNITGNAGNSNKDIVVTSKPKVVENYSIPFISMNTNKVLDMEVKATFSLESTPTLTRKRPESYIISATNPEIVHKLRQLGIVVQQAQSPFTTTVETYKVISYTQDYSLFEKFYPVKIKTEIIEKEIVFPAGTYIVPMNQRFSNLAASVLEPEAPNGFINYRVYETNINQELPIYRNIKSVK